MRPLRVYLDSSDFSVLSNCRQSDRVHESTIQQLRRWVTDQQISCLFSGTHLSEMAPLHASVADAAERRADILVELCGRNALISQDVLFESELRYAMRLDEHPPVVDSPTGDWYPGGVIDIAPIGSIEIASNFKEAIRDLGVNRTERRRATRKALKGDKPRSKQLAELVANARTGSLDAILEKYPMRPHDARVLNRYVVGDATAEEVRSAFFESLRDPRWMMQWFEKNHTVLTPFIEWTRKPAIALLDSLNEMAQHAATLRNLDARFGTSRADSVLSPAKRKTLEDEVLFGIASRMAERLISKDLGSLTLSTIDNRCPGLSVGIRSLYSAWWATLARIPRHPKLSDFPDALHAMYAPYVDVFRADSFMAPHIAKYASPFGVRVVPKQSGLVSVIAGALEEREKR